MASRLVIWGAGGHGLVVAEMARLGGEYDPVGWLDDVNPERQGSTHGGLPVLGGREQLDGLHDRGVHHIALAMGRCEARLRLADLVRRHEYQLPALVHPRASVGAGVGIGPGTIIKAGAIIDVECTIGATVIIAPAVVGHGSIVEDGVLLSGGVTLAGNVRVGRGSLIGAGATLRDRVRVGAGCLIGAGAVVLRDVEDGCVAYGVPARPMRRTRIAEGP